MQITVSAQNLRFTQALKDFTSEHLVAPVDKIWRKEGAELEIHLKDLRGPKGGVDQECRAIFHVPGGNKIVISEMTDDIRKSIHLVSKRLIRRVRQVLTQKVRGPRHPTKYYAAEHADKTLLGSRMPKARSIRHAQEHSM